MREFAEELYCSCMVCIAKNAHGIFYKTYFDQVDQRFMTNNIWYEKMSVLLRFAVKTDAAIFMTFTRIRGFFVSEYCYIMHMGNWWFHLSIFHRKLNLKGFFFRYENIGSSRQESPCFISPRDESFSNPSAHLFSWIFRIYEHTW